MVERFSLFLIKMRLQKCEIKLLIIMLIELELVSDRYKTQKMCIRAVNICSLVSDSVPDRYKTEVICIRAVDDNSSTIKYVSDPTNV